MIYLGSVLFSLNIRRSAEDEDRNRVVIGARWVLILCTVFRELLLVAVEPNLNFGAVYRPVRSDGKLSGVE